MRARPADALRYGKLRRSLGLKSKTRKTCRACGSSKLVSYLDLGVTPLANAYLGKKDVSRAEFKEELRVRLCRRCGLSQLSRVVAPERMFKHYLYASSTPETFRRHCEELARTAAALTRCRPGDLVLDIASNDGCLLSKFRDIGMRAIGVEPAENLAREANRNGIPTLCYYWSPPVAEDIRRRYGTARVITSTNVLAHVDDLDGFAAEVERCLGDGGVWIIEAPYLLDLIRKTEFDTIYHEHLSYFSVHPLRVLMERHGLEPFRLQHFPDIHGGTLRLYVCRRGDYAMTRSVNDALAEERRFGIAKLSGYRAFSNRIEANKKSLLQLLRRLRQEGRVIWAYGASAKGNTLTSYFGIHRELVPVAIDDNPRKWGYYTPGAHMEIVGIDTLRNSRVDYLLLLAWNFKDEIVRRCQAVGYRGRFISPVPRASAFRAVPPEIIKR